VNAKPCTPEEAQNVLSYLREHTRMSALSNEDLCREFLAVAPVFGRLGELGDILVERLCPGIIGKMDEETKPDTTPMPGTCARKPLDGIGAPCQRAEGHDGPCAHPMLPPPTAQNGGVA
jgi:hypothetical protein